MTGGAELSRKIEMKFILLLSLVVLVTYMNATRTGPLVLDDMALLNTIKGAKPSLSVFYSGNGPKYFRPLAYISYFLDKSLLNAHPVGLHFVNVLIHVCNSILVYCVALRLAIDEAARQRAAMVAALVFGLHPVNSEAVVWISSRYDLLCCFFFLASLLLITRQAISATPVSLAALFLMFLCSLLSKEASILLPVATAVFIFNNRATITFRNAGAIMAVLVLSLLFYLFLRNGPHIVADRGIGHSLAQPTTVDVADALLRCMSATGFYLKKMLYPFPLNFAISSIDDSFYLILSGFFFALSFMFFWHRQELRFPLAIIFTALIPPLYAMIGALPWVPYAERYLYIPMVGFTLLISLLSASRLKNASLVPVLCIALFLAVPTALRVNTWTDPVMFWKDAISKSPRFGATHLLLADELIRAGKLDEAERHVVRARELGFSRSSEINYARGIQTALRDARKGSLVK